MTLNSPYRNAGQWMRGSLHIHSTFSVCGWHGVEELALAYRDYDFIALSDHDRITTETDALENKVIFRAVEVSGNQHMLLVNAVPPIAEPIDSQFSLAHYGKLAAGVIDAGGLAVAAHPMRTSGQTWSLEELTGISHLTGMEVFSGDGIHVQEDIGFDLWDQVLSRGRRLWGFGNDDFHHWGQERRVWNMVNAAEKTPVAILNALRSGDFYISSGFDFESIETEDDCIRFRLRNDTPQHQRAYKYLTLYGQNGRVLAEQTGHFSEFSYRVTGDEGYVRAEAYMSGGYGAFSQPIYLETTH